MGDGVGRFLTEYVVNNSFSLGLKLCCDSNDTNKSSQGIVSVVQVVSNLKICRRHLSKPSKIILLQDCWSKICDPGIFAFMKPVFENFQNSH